MDDKWIIGVACHELGLEELQSELYDQPPVDEDMAGLMERMIETYGFPLDNENQFEGTYIGLP